MGVPACASIRFSRADKLAVGPIQCLPPGRTGPKPLTKAVSFEPPVRCESASKIRTVSGYCGRRDLIYLMNTCRYELTKLTGPCTREPTPKLNGASVGWRVSWLLSVITARSFEKLGDSATRFDVDPTASSPCLSRTIWAASHLSRRGRYCDSDSLLVNPDSPARRGLSGKLAKDRHCGHRIEA